MFESLKPKYPRVFRAFVLGSALALAAGCSAEDGITEENQNQVNEEPNPDLNVAYIVLDDAGFSDLGSYGSEIETPNLDRLAEDGLRYNNFNVTPLCSPTRASLLTGRNNHTVGMGSVANFDFGEEFPNKRGAIKPAAGTIAEVLSENGYNTYAVGKWHLAPTAEVTPAGPYHNWPLGKGFQRYYGFLEDSADQYRPELIEDNHPVSVPDKENYHFSEDVVDHSKQYLLDKMTTSPDTPFFLYMAFGAQHQPHQVPEKYIEMYDGVYDEGWDVIREQRFEKQKELGMIPEDTELSSRNPGVQAWEDVTEDEKEAFIRYQQTYAGFLTHTDEQIGRFIDFLEEKDELDNTVIVFISDNGASGMGGEIGSINQSLEYNFIPEDIDDIVERIEEMGGENYGTDYPAGWGQVSNTPFEFYKNSAFAGGTQTPMIVHWPDGIQDPGEIRSQYTYVSDITATIYDVIGIEPPESVNGVEQMPLHGKSFADTFHNEEAEAPRETQYFEMTGNRAIYHDGWRAVSLHEKGEPFEEDEWALYHVEEDFSQIRDVAEEEPEKLKELQDLWKDEADQYDVLPMSDNFVELLAHVPEDSPRARDQFTFYPEMSHLSDSASPPIINRSYTIDAFLHYENGDEGVLVASGNDKSGYTLYIKNGKVIYEYNAGFERYKMVSAEDLPTGDLQIQFKFDKTDEYAGVGKIYVNDEQVTEGEMDQTLPYKISFEGMDIGKDLLYPVSPDYEDEGDFEYTGELEKVIFELEDDVE